MNDLNIEGLKITVSHLTNYLEMIKKRKEKNDHRVKMIA